MLSSLVKRQTGHDHIDCYPGGCCRVKMTSFTIAWKTAITISHFFIHCVYLQVTTTTIHQRISLYTLSIFHTAKKKHTLHTLNVERISNEWRAPFVLLAINLHWDWGSRRNKPCAPGFNVMSTSHMKIMKSRYTTTLFSHCSYKMLCGLRATWWIVRSAARW